MATTNPITGDKIQTKQVTDQYRDNWEAIFGNKKADNVTETNPEEAPQQSSGTDQ